MPDTLKNHIAPMAQRRRVRTLTSPNLMQVKFIIGAREEHTLHKYPLAFTTCQRSNLRTYLK